MLVIDSAALPLFVRVITCAALGLFKGWLLNTRLTGDSATAGALEPPVPVKLALCGLPLALSATETAPVRTPAAVGLKVTVIVQLAPAAIELPQLLVCAKSPLAVTPVRLSDAPPV